jgi:hypothetical protein
VLAAFGLLLAPVAVAPASAAASVQPPAASAASVTPAVLSPGVYGASVGRRIPASLSLPLPSFPTFPVGPGGLGGLGGLGGGSVAPSLGGLVGGAINEWFTGLVKNAVNPAMLLVGRTLLSTPQITDDPTIKSSWETSLGVADTLLVLLVVTAGGLVMFHESLQSKYTVKDVLPRLALAAILANTSFFICAQMVSVSNALASALLGNGVNPEQAGHTLQTLIFNSIENGGIFFVLLGLVAAGVVVTLLVVHAVVMAVKVLGVVAAPLCLLAHGLPVTEGLAQLWWRGMTAVLGIQVAQALVLSGAVRVFFTTGGQGVVGLGTSGLSGLLLVLCLLFILWRIPFWAKELALTSRHRSDTARLAKTYITLKVISGALGGVL